MKITDVQRNAVGQYIVTFDEELSPSAALKEVAQIYSSALDNDSVKVQRPPDAITEDDLRYTVYDTERRIYLLQTGSDSKEPIKEHYISPFQLPTEERDPLLRALQQAV